MKAIRIWHYAPRTEIPQILERAKGIDGVSILRLTEDSHRITRELSAEDCFDGERLGEIFTDILGTDEIEEKLVGIDTDSPQMEMGILLMPDTVRVPGLSFGETVCLKSAARRFCTEKPHKTRVA